MTVKQLEHLVRSYGVPSLSVPDPLHLRDQDRSAERLRLQVRALPGHPDGLLLRAGQLDEDRHLLRAEVRAEAGSG